MTRGYPAPRLAKGAPLLQAERRDPEMDTGCPKQPTSFERKTTNRLGTSTRWNQSSRVSLLVHRTRERLIHPVACLQRISPRRQSRLSSLTKAKSDFGRQPRSLTESDRALESDDYPNNSQVKCGNHRIKTGRSKQHQRLQAKTEKLLGTSNATDVSSRVCPKRQGHSAHLIYPVVCLQHHLTRK